jgi:hypothetical protein
MLTLIKDTHHEVKQSSPSLQKKKKYTQTLKFISSKKAKKKILGSKKKEYNPEET